MKLQELEAFLDDPNPRLQMQAIAELRHYDPDVAVPLLKRRMHDEQFAIRSFVAQGLGYKRNDEAFSALLEIVDRETDHNVISEAVNSLSKYGPRGIPHLQAIFERNSHWLVRLSILAAMEDCDAPSTLFELCLLGFNGDNQTVQLTALSSLSAFKDTPHGAAAVEICLQAAKDSDALVRAQAVGLLRLFGGHEAAAVLRELSQDPDYRVVKAVLEGLL